MPLTVAPLGADVELDVAAAGQEVLVDRVFHQRLDVHVGQRGIEADAVVGLGEGAGVDVAAIKARRQRRHVEPAAAGLQRHAQVLHLDAARLQLTHLRLAGEIERLQCRQVDRRVSRRAGRRVGAAIGGPRRRGWEVAVEVELVGAGIEGQARCGKAAHVELGVQRRLVELGEQARGDHFLEGVERERGRDRQLDRLLRQRRVFHRDVAGDLGQRDAAAVDTGAGRAGELRDDVPAARLVDRLDHVGSDRQRADLQILGRAADSVERQLGVDALRPAELDAGGDALAGGVGLGDIDLRRRKTGLEAVGLGVGAELAARGHLHAADRQPLGARIPGQGRHVHAGLVQLRGAERTLRGGIELGDAERAAGAVVAQLAGACSDIDRALLERGFQRQVQAARPERLLHEIEIEFALGSEFALRGRRGGGEARRQVHRRAAGGRQTPGGEVELGKVTVFFAARSR
jgi:hypothetical protein